MPSLSVTRSGGDLGDAGGEAQDHAVVLELAGGVGVGLLGEGGEDDRAVVDEVDAGPLDVEVVEALRHHLVDEVGDGAGRLDAGRAGADDDDVEGALVDAGRVVVGGLEDLEQAGAQRLGVVDGVQREGVLLGARGVEEVRPRAGRQHEVVAGERLTVRRRHGPRRRVDRGHRHLLDGDRRRPCRRWRAAGGRCRWSTARPSPPGRAAAGTGGSCAGRAGSPRRRACRAPWRSRRRRSRRRRSPPRAARVGRAHRPDPFVIVGASDRRG